MENKEFSRYTHCAKCRRYIDEVTVKLKKLTISGDTYRQYNPEYLSKMKYEKVCTDCTRGLQ